MNKQSKFLSTGDLARRTGVSLRTIRFYAEEGNGLVVATRFGSTGYYQSITRSSFMEGIGIGFNNLRIPGEPIIMHESCMIEVMVERESAFLSADNLSEMITINTDDMIVIRDSGELCRFVTHE